MWKYPQHHQHPLHLAGSSGTENKVYLCSALIQKKSYFLHRKGDQILDWTAKGGGGVTIPGGFQGFDT